MAAEWDAIAKGFLLTNCIRMAGRRSSKKRRIARSRRKLSGSGLLSKLKTMVARENKVRPGTPPRSRIPLVTPKYFEKYKNALKERDPDKYGRVRNAEMDATIYS